MQAGRISGISGYNCSFGSLARLNEMDLQMELAQENAQTQLMMADAYGKSLDEMQKESKQPSLALFMARLQNIHNRNAAQSSLLALSHHRLSFFA